MFQPHTPAEIGDIVRRAAQEKKAIYPLGGRTMLDLGLPPTQPGFGVDLRALKRVIDYPARDMTATVQAGITLLELRNLLATEKQRLPIDAPMTDRATLGGAIAVNVSGLRRLGAGTLRDYVIGITTINDEGQETKAGGRVVKNVAGYDICKLHIGALGTLGIVSQVTLKLRPLPETKAILTFGCPSAVLASLLELIHKSRTRPVAVDAVNAAAAKAIRQKTGLNLPEAPWVVVVGFEDSNDCVTWQVHQLIKEIGALDVQGAEARAGEASDPLWTALGEFADQPLARLSFKANLLPSAVADFCLQAESLTGVVLQAHAGSGIVCGFLEADATLEQTSAMLKPLQEAAAKARGNLILPRCPTPWKRTLAIWGSSRADVWLMRKIKEKLDPRRLFNPGRFIDGI